MKYEKDGRTKLPQTEDQIAILEREGWKLVKEEKKTPSKKKGD